MCSKTIRCFVSEPAGDRIQSLAAMEPRPPEPKSSRNARQTGSVATPRVIDAPRKHKIPNLMRLPFFYGWGIVVVTFVTMALGVNARTAFSLFFPPIIDAFGRERGVSAGGLSCVCL